jgi:hypothetical protein
MVSSGAKWSTLIIRVWLTEGDPDSFRARLTEIDALVGPARTVAVARDADAVLSATRSWLSDVRWRAGDG